MISSHRMISCISATAVRRMCTIGDCQRIISGTMLAGQSGEGAAKVLTHCQIVDSLERSSPPGRSRARSVNTLAMISCQCRKGRFYADASRMHANARRWDLAE
jgi:hypothetical protein